MFVGFAAKETLARHIIDGAKSVRLLGEDIAVKAKIHTINGYSAHADRDELLAWHDRIKPGRTFLVHGEEAVMKTFAGLLKNTQVEMPAKDQAVEM